MKIKPFFKWYDLWMGIYIDNDINGITIYICFLPTLGIKIDFKNNLSRRENLHKKAVETLEKYRNTPLP